MALDIFSSFDDHHKVWSQMFFLMWSLPLLPFFLLLQIKPGYHVWSFSRLMSYNTTNKLIKLTGASRIGGMFTTIFIFMWMIVLMNMWGLFPYVFSMTSHMAINFPLALMMWITVTLLSLTYNPKSHLSHFSPMGAPFMLSPVLSSIEVVSNLVRPITLSVRLAANLSTGHVLFNLLGDSFTHTPMIIEITATILGMGYILFEMGVYVIQTYIFSLLSSLYADEHPSNN